MEVLDAGVLDASVGVATAVSIIAVPRPPASIVAPQPSPANIARGSTVIPLLRSTIEQAPTAAYSSAMVTSQQTLSALTSTIEEVASKTYDAWATAASDAQKGELRASRPSIPRDLDRALLVDLSEAIGEYTLSDAVRINLRAEFWAAVNRP